MFSNRTNWKIKPNRLSLELESLNKKGAPLLDLTESNPTHCGFEFYKHLPLDGLANPENKNYHPSPQGLKKTRETVAAYYKEKNADLSSEQIILTAGTSEAYAFLFRLLVNPGDTVLVPAPSYPLFDFLADLNDVTLAPYRLSYDALWHMPFENPAYDAAADAKALIVVHPNNPTGSFLKQGELHALNQWASKQNAALISDEVFLDYGFDHSPDRVSTLAANTACLTFTLGGISKSLGLPQMKLGWIAANGPEKLLKTALERLEIIADTYLSVNSPVQNAAPEWLALRGHIQKEIMARLQKNKNFLAGKIKEAPACEMLAQEGGWYSVLKIPRTRTEEEWALELLKKDGVYIHPGYFFNFEKEAFLVLSLLPAEKVFQEGVNRILARTKA